MEIRNVYESDIYAALAVVNARYAYNIKIKDIRRLRPHCKIGDKEVWQVTLTVVHASTKIIDSIRPRRVHVETLPGVKIRPAYSFRTWGESHEVRKKRIAAACWHVHGHFMDALPADCVILFGVRTVNGKPAKRNPGDTWYDFQVGSQAAPFMASQCCECNK
jgi:hypothetical protein